MLWIIAGVAAVAGLGFALACCAGAASGDARLATPVPSWPGDLDPALERAARASLPPLEDGLPYQFEYAEDVTLADGTPGLVINDAGGVVTLYLLRPYNYGHEPEQVVIVDRRTLARMLVAVN